MATRRGQPGQERRLQACAQSSQLQRHVDMVRMLGPDGMSSDELDESVPGQYNIIQPSWRSTSVSRWAHVMDVAYERQKNPPRLSTVSRGAPTPDRRVLSDGIHSTARPVKGLPIHAYDAKWYSELSELEKDNIHAVQEPYNFTHDEGLLQTLGLPRAPAGEVSSRRKGKGRGEPPEAGPSKSARSP